MSQEAVDRLRDEVERLVSLQGQPGVPQLLFVCPETLSMVTEFAGPTLEEHLQEKSLSVVQRVEVLRQIVKVLNRIHMRGLVYVNTHPQNICVQLCRNKDIAVTLTACGGSVPTGGQITVRGGGAEASPLMAPEVVAGQEVGQAADAFSVAHIIHILGLTGPCVFTLPVEARKWVEQSVYSTPAWRGSLWHLQTFLPPKFATSTSPPKTVTPPKTLLVPPPAPAKVPPAPGKVELE